MLHTAHQTNPKTNHAMTRLDQRDIRTEFLKIVLDYGTEYPAGRQCTKRMLTLSDIDELLELGFSISSIDRAKMIEIILGPDGSIITAYKRNFNVKRPQTSSRRKNSRNNLR